MSTENLTVGPEIARRICSAIGVEFKLVRSIQIVIEADDVARIYIERFVEEGEMKRVVEVFEAVDWRPQPNKEGEPE